MEPGFNGQMNLKTKRYDVKIPPGTTNGSRIRLSGQGGKGVAGGQSGDLFLKVNITPHHLFKVNDYDLEFDLEITPWEAALGAKITVPTLDSPVTMTIPPGTQSGNRMRLKGKGLPKKGNNKGNLYAVIKIVVPKKLSPKERELFQNLAKDSTFNPRKK
jgi:curved DNA-binding protein